MKASEILRVAEELGLSVEELACKVDQAAAILDTYELGVGLGEEDEAFFQQLTGASVEEVSRMYRLVNFE